MSDTPIAFLARLIRVAFGSGNTKRKPDKARVRAHARLVIEALEDRTTPSTITTLPYVITSPGTYDLAADLYYGATSGNAITVRAEGVTIDMHGHRIWSATGASTTAVGIAANQQSYITIQNGTIQGFQYGIQLVGTARNGNHVQNMTLAQNWYFGLWVDGTNAVINNNQVINTGGCNIPGYTTPIAIHLAGANASVTNNTVLGMVRCPGLTQELVCLALDAAPNATVTGNTFALNSLSSGSYGIWANSTGNNYSTNVQVENNYFANLDVGCAFAYAYAHFKNNQFANVRTKWVVPNPSNVDLGGNVSTTTVTLPTAPSLPALVSPIPPVTPALVLRGVLPTTAIVTSTPTTGSRFGASQPTSAPSGLKVVTAYRAI